MHINVGDSLKIMGDSTKALWIVIKITPLVGSNKEFIHIKNPQTAQTAVVDARRAIKPDEPSYEDQDL